MKQTPLHERHNPDLLSLVPRESMKLIEVGCSSGALAREFKKLSPGVITSASRSMMTMPHSRDGIAMKP